MDKKNIIDYLNFRDYYNKAIPFLKGAPQASGKCVFHDDKRASFSVNLNTGLWMCHAGCGSGDILEFHMKLHNVDFPTALKELGEIAGIKEVKGKKIKAIYDYTDEKGILLYQVVRYEPKDFRPRHKGPNGEWVYGLEGVRRVPYNLPKVINSAEIIIVEGEKDSDNLKVFGYTVTTICGGANAWREEYRDHFSGKSVAIVHHLDEPGRKFAGTVARSLLGTASSIRIVSLPLKDGEGKDASDFIALRRKEGKVADEIKAELDLLIEKTSFWESKEVQPEPDTIKWPFVNPDMFYGLTGEIVKAIEPHTEADPVALLIQILAAFGNIIGKGAYFEVEADKHYPNIFAALVGPTSKGRKGTSLGHVLRLFKSIVPVWENSRIQTGLSSGEGLLWAVRDPINRKEPIKEKNKIVGYQDVISDEGIEDKRLLVIEPEFASVLKIAGREGNTLSAVLRQSWDSGNLRTLTKNSPLKATGAHISLISHITREELLRYLNTTEIANGFANRFLWFCVKRSKCLPRGGKIQKVNFEPIIKKLEEAIELGKRAGSIEPSEGAWKVWEEIYPDLSDGRPGLLGATTSRSEAQVMRVAMIYALMDGSTIIHPQHLHAALALWDYAFESAKYIFGDTMGNPTADEILNALRNNTEGLTRTDINNLFGRHKASTDIAHALNLLLKKGLVIKKEIQTEGRNSELWVAKKAKEAK